MHQVVTQMVAAAAAKSGPCASPETVLADVANVVTQTIVSAVVPVTLETASTGVAPAKVTARSAGRFAWQLTANQHMQDLLEEAQELIGHAGPRDLASVLERALTLLVESLRKSKHAETSRPRAPRETANGRHVPAAVARAVWERDGHQCTFRGDDGRRCSERSDLQMDHVIPFALGGRTTVENLRLLCRAHNQYEAERVFGEEHMREQRAAAQARAEKAAAARGEAAARANAEKAEGARAEAASQAGG
jgi:5-methylcytosine-specific restriction endonuclease McrA